MVICSMKKNDPQSKAIPLLNNVEAFKTILATFNAPHEAVLIADEHERILHFNPAAEKMFGLTATQTLGLKLNQLIAPQTNGKRAKTKMSGLIELARAKSVPFLGRHSTGKHLLLEASLKQTETEGKTMYALLLRSLSAPARTADGNSTVEMRATIFNAAYEFLGLLQPDGALLDANSAALDFVGVTLADVKGRPFGETPWWAHDEVGRAQLQAGIAAAARGEFVRFEARHHGVLGDEITVDFSLKPVRDRHGAIILLVPEGRDITEQKQLEAQLLRAQRMESIGTLAGGIAHDLNNILSPLSMGLQVMQMKYSDEYAQKILGLMNASVQRGADMVKQILQFARGISGERIRIQLPNLRLSPTAVWGSLKSNPPRYALPALQIGLPPDQNL